MQYVKNDVMTLCVGQAASMGGVTFGIRTSEKRLALPNSRILIHQPSMGGLSGQATDIDIHAREILRMREITNQLLSKHSGQKLDKVEKDVERDFIMNAQQGPEEDAVVAGEDVVADAAERPVPDHVAGLQVERDNAFVRGCEEETRRGETPAATSRLSATSGARPRRRRPRRAQSRRRPPSRDEPIAGDHRRHGELVVKWMRPNRLACGERQRRNRVVGGDEHEIGPRSRAQSSS